MGQTTTGRATSGIIARVLICAAFSLLGTTATRAQSAISPPVQLQQASFPKLYNTLSSTRARSTFPIAVLDINGDEMMDVYIGQGRGRNDLIALQHPGQPWSVHSLDDDTDETHGVLAADVNRDFIDDLIVTRDAGVSVYLGLPRGGFRKPVMLPDSAHDGATRTRQLIAGDINNDGWTDLFAVRGSNAGNGAGNRLWINLGVSPNPRFREAASGAGVLATGDNVAAVFADLDDDGATDLVVSSAHGEPLVFRNDGDGNFVETPVQLPVLDNVAGMTASDVDQDGDIDLLLTISSPEVGGGLLFLRNDGGFQLTDTTKMYGLNIDHGINDAVWVDLNNDGHRDLLATGAANGDKARSFAMVQQHSGEFQRVELDGYFDKVPAFWIVSDFNRDGVMDMLGVPRKGEIALRHGARSRNNWLGVKLRGRANRSVYGASVTLRMADGTHYHNRYGMKRNVTGTADRELMFGLGRRSEISMLEINWPSGKYTRVDDPDFNRHIGFVEPKGDAGSADLSIQHTIVNRVAAIRKARRENPDLVLGKPEQQYVCR